MDLSVLAVVLVSLLIGPVGNPGSKETAKPLGLAPVGHGHESFSTQRQEETMRSRLFVMAATGADPGHVNKAGRLPAETARARGHGDIAALLDLADESGEQPAEP